MCAYRVLLAAVDEVGLDEVRGSCAQSSFDIQEASAPWRTYYSPTLAVVQSSPVITITTIGHRLNMATTKGKGTRYTTRLVVVFCLWKILLLTLAAFCPGPGYDTSTLILLDPSINRHKNFHKRSRTDRLILNLSRWDALYFVKAAERGKVHEQEWAFSWAYSKLLGFVGQCK
jgi:hypothetical protein